MIGRFEALGGRRAITRKVFTSLDVLAIASARATAGAAQLSRLRECEERGNVVHSNLSAPEEGAFTAGELRFVHKPGEQPEVIINGGSGRYGPATAEQWDATIKLFRAKGFKVNAVPFNLR